jgi:acetyl-CoA carboxylase biotin carboxyl carrier protein
MDLRKLKTLIDLVAESGIAELEVTEGEDKVRIVKTPSMPTHAVTYLQAPQMAMPMPMSAASAGQAASSAALHERTGAASDAAPASVDGHVVKSPMVGSFYRSAQPGTAPLVDIGSEVEVGQTLCIIEAMKLLNEIESDKAGRIKAVLVENGQPVEYGQPLFVIE